MKPDAQRAKEKASKPKPYKMTDSIHKKISDEVMKDYFEATTPPDREKDECGTCDGKLKRIGAIQTTAVFPDHVIRPALRTLYQCEKCKTIKID